ncbi:hypothetical protein TSUD_263630 [Trifolium subterraneum]|uniref:Uncharacterized protein n=1 Tax=Trifolium subterraneum TaxID=3900 RepID=A0A2Z6NFA5_TRISU|nr:hypothetical protein TSUD_263630 [Trifolium subterraneum]
MPYDLGNNHNSDLANIRDYTNEDVVNVVNLIVAGFVERVNNGWFFGECLTAYHMYVQYMGNFTAMQNCDELSHRSVEEIRLKIRRDHNYCVEHQLTTPWGQIHSLLNIEIVEHGSGNPHPML